MLKKTLHKGKPSKKNSKQVLPPSMTIFRLWVWVRREMYQNTSVTKLVVDRDNPEFGYYTCYYEHLKSWYIPDPFV